MGNVMIKLGIQKGKLIIQSGLGAGVTISDLGVTIAGLEAVKKNLIEKFEQLTKKSEKEDDSLDVSKGK